MLSFLTFAEITEPTFLMSLMLENRLRAKRLARTISRVHFLIRILQLLKHCAHICDFLDLHDLTKPVVTRK